MTKKIEKLEKLFLQLDEEQPTLLRTNIYLTCFSKDKVLAALAYYNYSSDYIFPRLNPVNKKAFEEAIELTRSSAHSPLVTEAKYHSLEAINGSLKNKGQTTVDEWVDICESRRTIEKEDIEDNSFDLDEDDEFSAWEAKHLTPSEVKAAKKGKTKPSDIISTYSADLYKKALDLKRWQIEEICEIQKYASKAVASIIFNNFKHILFKNMKTYRWEDMVNTIRGIKKKGTEIAGPAHIQQMYDCVKPLDLRLANTLKPTKGNPVENYNLVLKCRGKNTGIKLEQELSILPWSDDPKNKPIEYCYVRIIDDNDNFVPVYIETGEDRPDMIHITTTCKKALEKLKRFKALHNDKKFGLALVTKKEM